MTFKKVTLTNEMRNIKKFARYGLLSFSEHAWKRTSERHIDRHRLISMIASNNARITQYKQKGCYHNSNDRYVIDVKNETDNYQAVIEKVISEFGGIHYNIVTAYKPSPIFFKQDGCLRNKWEREMLAPMQ